LAKPKPMTANQLKASLKAQLKEAAVGNPFLAVLIPILLPILMKWIENLLEKNDVIPKAEA